MAGGEDIFVGLNGFDAGGDAYNIELRGMVGYNSATIFSAQPGVSPAVYLHLSNAAMTYWFIANGQRVIIIVKVSTVYQMAYLGKILPYATPDQYPYPVLIAGMSSSSTLRWSSTFRSHSAPFNPGSASARLCWPDGTWYEFENADGTSTPTGPSANRFVWPTHVDPADGAWSDIRDNVGGDYSLFPLILFTQSPASNLVGEMEGIYWVTGFGTASENIITIGGVNYMVVQNAYRTGPGHYCAVRMN
jgi:hypothetical protein